MSAILNMMKYAKFLGFGNSANSGGGDTGWDGVYRSEWPSSIGSYAYYANDELKSININYMTNSVPLQKDVTVGENACYNTKALDTVEIIIDELSGFDSQTTLTCEKNAFGASSVSSVLFYAGSVYVGEAAFAECRNLETINFRGGKIDIGAEAFCDCEALRDFRALVVDNVAANAFLRCSSLEKITLPHCLSIEMNAFTGCTNLKAVILKSTTGKNLDIAILAFLDTGIVGDDGTPTGEGFVYVPTNAFEAYVEHFTAQAVSLVGDAAVAEDIVRSILRKIEDYPEICG